MTYKTLDKLSYKKEDKYIKAFEERFRSPSTIHINFEVAKQKCFLVQSHEVVKLMYDILRLDKEIARLCRSLPGKAIQQYSKKCLIDEIVLTNNIEGVQSSRREIGDALAVLEYQSDRKGKKTRFLGMVNRYFKFMSDEEVRIETCQDIRNIYDEIVLDEVLQENPDHAPDGVIFRKDQATLWTEMDRELHTGITPEASIIEHMDRALAFLHDESIEQLYRICIFHYLLEYIHPFYDGNGRLGRFIMSYGILNCLEPILAFRISETIKENINAYYRAFKICNHARNKGELTPFLIMMLTMIKDSEEELTASLQQKLNDWDHGVIKIKEKMNPESERELRLYDVLIQAALFSELGIPREELQNHMMVSPVTLRKDLKAIEDKGLLESTRADRRLYYRINMDKLNNI